MEAYATVSDGCGGATSSYYTDVRLRRRGWLGGRKHILMVRGEVQIKLEWASEESLVVWFDATSGPIERAKVRVEEWQGIKIEYRPWLL